MSAPWGSAPELVAGQRRSPREGTSRGPAWRGVVVDRSWLRLRRVSAQPVGELAGLGPAELHEERDVRPCLAQTVAALEVLVAHEVVARVTFDASPHARELLR